MAEDEAPFAPRARRAPRRVEQQPCGIVRAHPPQLHQPQLAAPLVKREARGIEPPQLLGDGGEQQKRLLLLFQ